MAVSIETDELFVRRALELARQGRGRVEPNPMVGCVIVKEGRVIGEGYHQRFGGPHAEPNALAACIETPAGATAYVSLEPCCHSNKKTPPCVPALIEAKLARVVAGCADPNPSVSGKGMEQLRAAGIAVISGVLEAEAKQLNAPFFASVLHHRPYVTLKWAQTADRKVAGPGGRRIQISGNESTREVHRLRARSDGILVGIRTLLNDDPLLTTRGVPDARPITRIVLDRDLQTRVSSQLIVSSKTTASIICCSQETYDHKGWQWINILSDFQISLLPLPEDADGRLSIAHLLEALGKTSMTHLLVEPGPSLAESMMRQGLVDRVWVFGSPDRINDATAPVAASVSYPPVASVQCGRDVLTEYLNPQSAVYFAPRPSADLLLTQLSGK